MPVLRLPPGSIFARDFEIIGPLAEGGMGSVYVAKQLSTGKERALKIMQPQFASDARTRERFTREARAGSQIDSEHVVEVVAAGIEAESQIPWLAMELLRGEDLGAYVDRVGPLRPAQALDIFRQLCHGLAAAHASGLIHRDLKPENIFLSTSRRVGVPYTVKLLDFGIAKAVTETRSHVTDAVGTPTWMAPEQTESGRPITPAADVWALGLVAFRMLTGVNYWKSANEANASAMAVLREVVFEPMEPASIRARNLKSAVELSAAFDGWFARCVNREPNKRIQNATDALTALEPVLLLENKDGVPSTERVVQFEPLPPTARGAPPAFAEPLPVAMATLDMPATQIVSLPNQTVRGIESMTPREDVDTYQRRLSRGRYWTWAGLAVAALVAGGALWRFKDRATAAPEFTGTETEPNNRAPLANRVPFGERVRAQIGQRLSDERSDLDFFEIDVPEDAGLVALEYEALPNIAPCLLLYKKGVGDPFGRYCPGRADRSLSIPALRLEPAKYIVAVTQDREQYTKAPAPPVLENVSDAYTLVLRAATPQPDFEVEPNDTQALAGTIGAGTVMKGRLAWMRDVDVVCAGAGTGRVQLAVEEDDRPRPRGAALEVTPLGGPESGIPVRLHPQSAEGTETERDRRGTWQGEPFDLGGSEKRCVSLTLVRDVWSEPPLPNVPAASDQTYTVRLERP